ncbi:MAG: hypothetical protein EAZ84_07545 [Verrucomicrobia bacterium]|nr:MAG: hypothetical protein EAZ84_07545 [Verrucomicrobiota bacterium]TAE88686.1 MAG: hypothetical protein EAZ82_03005 [Verrucomicrobiota bacterium]TAF26487.1 MAG: hypothetical protein EAZ71_04530 [Verrucomicrobiota bacterium]
MNLLLMIKWRLEVGDPGLIGWITVGAYALALLLVVRAWSRCREKIWLVVALLLAALCVNKQIDLQSLLTELGREWSQLGGWYERRREFQKGFVIGLLVGSLVSGLWFLWRFQAFVRSHKLLALGLLFLLAFVVARAASFHHIDAFFQSLPKGWELSRALEPMGILLIAWAAFREGRSVRRDRVSR